MLPPAAARLPLLTALAGLALAYGLTAAWPASYSASASVMLPAGASHGSRIMRITHAAADPQAALERTRAQLSNLLQNNAQLVDPAMVRPQRPSLPLNLALGGLGGLALGAGFALARRRHRRAVRVSPGSALGLCEQLLANWFTPQRRLLPLVSADAGEGRSRLAAQLAVAFAELGHRTLLIDADLRAPSLHRAFDLPGGCGLADFLQDRRASLASAGDNLSLMIAGNRGAADPLELLSSARLPALLAEAGKHFPVILVDTPAAEHGPDFQIFAALAGGALVVGAGGVEAALARCGAKVVARV